MGYRVGRRIGNTRRVASIDRPPLIRPSAPKQRVGEGAPVSLVRKPAESAVPKVSLVRRRPVDLTKKVSLAKRPKREKDLWTPSRPPVRSHRRARLAPTRVFSAVGTGAARSGRATRAWARRPVGRMVVPGLLMALLVGVAFAAGAWLPEATGNEPVATAPSDEEVPSEGAELPGQPGKDDKTDKDQ